MSLKYLYAQTDRDVVALGKSSESQVTSYGRWTATANGSYRLYRSKATGLCLDSNSSGNVYLRSCSTGNNFQNWLLVKEGTGFYRLKNRATGLCLDSSYAGSVYTNPCSSSNAYQHWS
ncbi:RICIN domain-containing protein [Janibacter hoylei]|uniref:RICIN domain-containing protein n=1 Tax=Janibacter hoylei TaxID=364298 RepID=UPI0035CCD7C4